MSPRRYKYQFNTLFNTDNLNLHSTQFATTHSVKLESVYQCIVTNFKAPAHGRMVFRSCGSRWAGFVNRCMMAEVSVTSRDRYQTVSDMCRVMKL